MEHTAKRCLWRHSEQGRSQLLPVGHSTWLWGAQAQQEQRGQHRTQAFILRVLLTQTSLWSITAGWLQTTSILEKEKKEAPNRQQIHAVVPAEQILYSNMVLT